MCYTSGTTGNPKGVVYSHRSRCCTAWVHDRRLARGERARHRSCPIVPMFHANAWGLAHAGVMAGASFVMPGPDLSAPAIADADGVRARDASPPACRRSGRASPTSSRAATSRRSRGSSAAARPFRRSLSETLPREDRHLDPPGLGDDRDEPARVASRRVKSTLGEPARPGARRRPRDAPGCRSPARRLCGSPTRRPATSCRGTARRAASCRSSGPWIAAGYYNDERSGDSFTVDGWLKTGDIATIDAEGYIRLVDRTKDLIKSGGEWISSVELENEIMAHPQVREAAVDRRARRALGRAAARVRRARSARAR